MARAILRFAPSPNGPLHLGHALSALLNAEAAARLDGACLIRLEDLDRARCTQALGQAALDDLAWLGIVPAAPVLRQSQNLARYAADLERLRARGLVYPCCATRGEIAAAVRDRPDHPRDPEGVPLYPGLWRGAPASAIEKAVAAGAVLAWRLDVARALSALSDRPLGWWEQGERSGPRWIEAHPARWGDVVLGRKDAGASYHLAVTTDDADQAVTHVVRGRDLKEATALHVLLAALLGYPQCAYLHHRLIDGPDGRKLSKSAGAEGLAALRQAGAQPSDIRTRIAWSPADDLAHLHTTLTPGTRMFHSRRT